MVARISERIFSWTSGYLARLKVIQYEVACVVSKAPLRKPHMVAIARFLLKNGLPSSSLLVQMSVRAVSSFSHFWGSALMADRRSSMSPQQSSYHSLRLASYSRKSERNHG